MAYYLTIIFVDQNEDYLHMGRTGSMNHTLDHSIGAVTNIKCQDFMPFLMETQNPCGGKDGRIAFILSALPGTLTSFDFTCGHF